MDLSQNIGTDCLDGAGCYFGCSGRGYRGVRENDFANSQRIDNEVKKHVYEPVSERFIKDIFDCCYPDSCEDYDSEHCNDFFDRYDWRYNRSLCNTCP